MANIRIDLDIPVMNGQSVTFKSPADCSAVTGLIAYYPENGSTKSQVFMFADAHGNNLGKKDLFASDVLVKVLLDTELQRAYVQNADTNAYLEGKFGVLENFQRVKVDTVKWTASTSHQGYMENVVAAACVLKNPIWSITGASENALPTENEIDACNSVPYMIASAENLTFLTKETTAPATFYVSVQGVTVKG